MRQLMLGNKALARGLYEGGCSIVSSYPGTPSTEVTEEAVKFEEIYCEWAPNEKVALETAFGASLAGKRSFCGMKHVGLNVAADPLFTCSYTGVNGGLIICVADDPAMHSSQNEQDSRHYAIAAKVPMLEPADSAETCEFAKAAYEISEEFDTPVIIRMCTRIAHSQSRPKVILPIVERTEAAILEKAAAFSSLCADCVEWRVDLFDAAADPGAVVRCLAKLRVLLKEKLLLVTLRTKEEGGSIPVSHEGYLRFLRTVLDTDCADLIDIEFFTAGADLPALVQDAHTAGVKVVCSSHDFHKTPPKAELVSRMVVMQQAGADLPKLAVMPQSRADVLELLAATAEMTDHHPETPVITMSMGALGAVSRLCGEAFGSAMTFANPGTASAPGQVGLDVVNAVLDSLRLS